MSEAPDRFIWAFWRRLRMGMRISGFWASRLSYATPDCKFAEHNRLYRHTRLRSTRLGRMSYVAEGTRIGFSDIGAFCSIGPNVLLGGLGWHPADKLSTHPAFYSANLQAGASYVGESRHEELPRVTVGNDVWIGAGSIILDGITIGDGAIIAAGAVVTKPVEPYAIVGGVPAKLIRYRFDEATREALLRWQWWKHSDAQLKRHTQDFMTQEAWTPDSIRTLAEQMGAEPETVSAPAKRTNNKIRRAA